MIKRPRRDVTNSKAARLVILYLLDQEGLLDGLSAQKIADLFGPDAPTRFTIFRDRQRLAEIKAEYERIKARIKIKHNLP